MPSPSCTPSPPTSSTPSLRSWAERSPRRVAFAACAGLAALSLLLPWAAGYDAWAWLVWGRELTQSSLDLRGGPAWKPFPVLFTALFGPFGGAGPDLWLLVARTGALLSLVLCFRLG